jgi:cytochrome b561
MNLSQKQIKPKLTSSFQKLWSLHWLMAVCFLVLYLVGIVMSRLSDEITLKDYMFDFHKSIGVLVIGLLLLRMFFLLQVFGKKYLKRQPKLNKQWIQGFTLHSLLYLFMLIVPLSGFLYSNSGGHEVAFFGIATPNLFQENQTLFPFARSLHFWLSYTFLAFILLHAWENHRFILNFRRRFFKLK